MRPEVSPDYLQSTVKIYFFVNSPFKQGTCSAQVQKQILPIRLDNPPPSGDEGKPQKKFFF